MSSTFPTLKERLTQVQQTCSLSSGQLAKELKITPEWLSKILNGHARGSDDIGLRLDAYLRRRQVEVGSADRHELETSLLEESHPQESSSSRHAADAIRNSIRRDIEGTFVAAGDNLQRLHWVAEQVKEHVAIPRNWKSSHPDLVTISPKTATGQRHPSSSHPAQSA